MTQTNQNNPKYPLYIVSKWRFDSRLTSKALERMGVPYYIVVEEQEYDDYVRECKGWTVLILDKKYQDEYDTFDDLGNTKSKWPGAARNFAWEHSIKMWFAWHWVMDDNINRFYRLNENLKVPIYSGVFFRAQEDFCERYTNVAMAGPNYFMFAPRKQQIPPFVTNTRIYSCNFIRNDTPYRWRGRYNEDTDISLRMLKDWWCTIQFNAFLQEKLTTQTLKGWNTDAFYAKDGTMPKTQMQVRMHPDVSKLVWKFWRWHHQVDYTGYKKNKLIRKPDLDLPEGVNNYWLSLKKVES
jgi:hypothetical protein